MIATTLAAAAITLTIIILLILAALLLTLIAYIIPLPFIFYGAIHGEPVTILVGIMLAILLWR